MSVALNVLLAAERTLEREFAEHQVSRHRSGPKGGQFAPKGGAEGSYGRSKFGNTLTERPAPRPTAPPRKPPRPGDRPGKPGPKTTRTTKTTKTTTTKTTGREPPMRRGDRGERVRALQELLSMLGLDTQADGVLGEHTEEQIRAAQRKLGLRETGKASKALLRRMADAAKLSPCISREAVEARLTEAVEAHTGAMVALLPSRADVDRLAEVADEDPDELHATLYFLGEADGWDARARAELIARVAGAFAGVAPIAARGFNVALFNPDGDEPCVTLGVSGVGLARARKLAGSALAGFDLPAQHSPWVAHVTLAYGEEDVADYTDAIGPVTFDRVRVAFGGEITDIALTGAVRESAADVLRVAEANYYNIRHGKGTGDVAGQFRRLDDMVAAAIKDWLSGDAKAADPLDEFDQRQLKAVIGRMAADARKRGDTTRAGRLTPPIRSSKNELKLRLYADAKVEAGSDRDVPVASRPAKEPATKAATKKVETGFKFNPRDVADSINGQTSESGIVALLAGDDRLTASRLRKLADELGIDVPEGMRAKSALQLHIAERVARERGLPSGFEGGDTPSGPKAAKKAPTDAAPRLSGLPSKPEPGDFDDLADFIVGGFGVNLSAILGDLDAKELNELARRFDAKIPAGLTLDQRRAWLAPRISSEGVRHPGAVPFRSDDLSSLSRAELVALAGEVGVPNAGKLNMRDLREEITAARERKPDTRTPAGGRPKAPEPAVETPETPARTDPVVATSAMLKDQVDAHGLIDVGAGVERHLGISRNRLDQAIDRLVADGYEIHNVQIDQVGGAGKTTVKTLARPGTGYREVKANRNKIRAIVGYSDDRGRTYEPIRAPLSIDSRRLKVNYAEDGGDRADGVVYVRPGVEDLSLGGARYAQVRIAIDGSHYIKGMAVYRDDLPDGVDLVFNTKKSDTGNKLDALKPLQRDRETGEVDPDLPFGTVIRRQLTADDGQGGKRVSSAMNLVYEEGRWSRWSRSLSSQVLSKQSPQLARAQLGALRSRRRAELDQILGIDQPVVRRKLLGEYAEAADSAAVDLSAAALPRQSWRVILPEGSLAENEVYAPGYRDGERVVLIRHPHAGTFEIPELVVNNSSEHARRLLGDAPDAVAINPAVAARLSGADFDGDTVLVIPNEGGDITTTPALAGLADFDPSAAYPARPGAKPMSKATEEAQMGMVSNLITDMTIQGASLEEITRAVRHSMVVIDARKHKLDYRRSAEDHGIAELRAKYQGGGGASTLISRASSEAPAPATRPRGIDPATGRLIAEPILDAQGNPRTRRVERLAVADDARALISDADTEMERIYAEHSNELKALANEARRELAGIGTVKKDPVARRAYADEVAALTEKLNLALMNAPVEREAQRIASAIVERKRAAAADLPKAELAAYMRKVEAQAIRDARERVQAGKTRIHITDEEWEAIRAGALSDSMLSKVLANADPARLRALALPGRGDQTESQQEFDDRAAKAKLADAAHRMAALGVEPTMSQMTALSRMGGDGAYVVNADLRRGGGLTSTDKNAATVEQIDSLLNASPLSDDAVVYRRAQIRDVFGPDVEVVGDLTGLSWRDHGYVSTSTQRRESLSGGANMKILVPRGTPGFSHAALDSDEILLGRGLTFEVVADHRGENVDGPIDVMVRP